MFIFKIKRVTACHKDSKELFRFVWNRSVNSTSYYRVFIANTTMAVTLEDRWKSQQVRLCWRQQLCERRVSLHRESESVLRISSVLFSLFSSPGFTTINNTNTVHQMHMHMNKISKQASTHPSTGAVVIISYKASQLWGPPPCLLCVRDTHTDPL